MPQSERFLVHVFFS